MKHKRFIFIALCLYTYINLLCNQEDTTLHNDTKNVAYYCDYTFEKGSEYTKKGIEIARDVYSTTSQKITKITVACIENVRNFLGY